MFRRVKKRDPEMRESRRDLSLLGKPIRGDGTQKRKKRKGKEMRSETEPKETGERRVYVMSNEIELKTPSCSHQTLLLPTPLTAPIHSAPSARQDSNRESIAKKAGGDTIGFGL